MCEFLCLTLFIIFCVTIMSGLTSSLENMMTFKDIPILSLMVLMLWSLVLFHTLSILIFFFLQILQVISEIIETCRSHEFTDVVLVHEHRGVPDGLIISHLPFGPTAYFQLLNVVSSVIIFLLIWTYMLVLRLM